MENPHSTRQQKEKRSGRNVAQQDAIWIVRVHNLDQEGAIWIGRVQYGSGGRALSGLDLIGSDLAGTDLAHVMLHRCITLLITCRLVVCSQVTHLHIQVRACVTSGQWSLEVYLATTWLARSPSCG